MKPTSLISAPYCLSGLPRDEVRAWALARGLPAYRGEQVFRWLHRHGVRSPSAMRNLPAKVRQELKAGLLPGLSHVETLTGADGTRKLLFRTFDGHRIESVLIPMGAHFTQCLSSQVGCRLACSFCLTGRMGLERNLNAGEIVAQVQAARGLDTVDGMAVRNLVFMGMGEPLDNITEVIRACRILIDAAGFGISGRRITVSTAGVAGRLHELGAAVPVNLAVSLNAPTDAQRARIMPVNRRYPLAKLKETMRRFPLPQRRRITIEYMLLAGFNDRPIDVRNLIRFLEGLRVKVNLLSWNPFPLVEDPQGPSGRDSAHATADSPRLERPTQASVRAFQERLLAAGLPTSIRISKGLDIGAACGQLDALPDQAGTADC